MRKIQKSPPQNAKAQALGSPCKEDSGKTVMSAPLFLSSLATFGVPVALGKKPHSSPPPVPVSSGQPEMVPLVPTVRPGNESVAKLEVAFMAVLPPAM